MGAGRVRRCLIVKATAAGRRRQWIVASIWMFGGLDILTPQNNRGRCCWRVRIAFRRSCYNTIRQPSIIPRHRSAPHTRRSHASIPGRKPHASCSAEAAAQKGRVDSREKLLLLLTKTVGSSPRYLCSSPRRRGLCRGLCPRASLRSILGQPLRHTAGCFSD